MKTLLGSICPVLLVLAGVCCAPAAYAQSSNGQPANGQSDQQAAPPPSNQSSYPANNQKMTPAEKGSTALGHGHMVNLNTGTKADLAALPGVGPAIAQNIIDGRPYQSKNDLLKKKVIPQNTFDQIQNLVTAQGSKKQSLPQ
jgi:competence protein ComEA